MKTKKRKQPAAAHILPKAEWVGKLTSEERKQAYLESVKAVGAELDTLGVTDEDIIRLASSR